MGTTWSSLLKIVKVTGNQGTLDQERESATDLDSHVTGPDSRATDLHL
jgi:hypothetical protein